MLERVRRDLRHRVHGVDDVVDVLVIQRILARRGRLRAFPGIAEDVPLLRFVRAAVVGQIARDEIRHRGGAGEARDPVLHVARDAVCGEILLNALTYELRAVVEAIVPPVGRQRARRRIADRDVRRPLRAVARAAAADGDERVGLVLLRVRVPDRDLLGADRVADGVVRRALGQTVRLNVRKAAVREEIHRIDGFAVNWVGFSLRSIIIRIVPRLAVLADNVALRRGIARHGEIKGAGGKGGILQIRPEHGLRGRGVVDRGRGEIVVRVIERGAVVGAVLAGGVVAEEVERLEIDRADDGLVQRRGLRLVGLDHRRFDRVGGDQREDLQPDQQSGKRAFHRFAHGVSLLLDSCPNRNTPFVNI